MQLRARRPGFSSARPLSRAAVQGSLHATRAAECYTVSDSQTAMDKHRYGGVWGAVIEIRGGHAATKRRWSLLSASRTGENAKCKCLPAENAV